MSNAMLLTIHALDALLRHKRKACVNMLGSDAKERKGARQSKVSIVIITKISLAPYPSSKRDPNGLMKIPVIIW